MKKENHRVKNFKDSLKKNPKEPYDLIDKDLLEMVLDHQDYDNSIYVKTDKVIGEFFLEGMVTRLHYSDEQLDAIEAAQNILLSHNSDENIFSSNEINNAKDVYYNFLQAHNHELFHFYQVLSLPAFQVVRAIRRHYLEIETVVMLKHLEAGKSYKLGEHLNLLDIIKTGEFDLDCELAEKINDINKKYYFYVYGWQKEIEGVSLFNIIEGMAHIMSLQLSDTPKIDKLYVEDSPEYLSAFNVFLKYLKIKDLDVRYQYLLFIYICYFSCQIVNRVEDKDSLGSIRAFHFLCSRAGEYVNTWKKLVFRYEKYPKSQLLELLNFGINRSDVENEEASKIRLTLSFFELITMIKSDVDKLNFSAYNPEFEAIEKIKASIKLDNVIPNNIYEIALMAIFPAKFVNIRFGYDRLEEKTFDGQSYNFTNEANFYRFIDNCKKLLSCCSPVPCCEEHGEHEDLRQILKCKNEGGLAFFLEQLLNRPATELFKV